MKNYAARKNAYFGKLCRHGHDHGGGCWRAQSNATCMECADARVVAWSKTPAGRASHKAAKARRAPKKIAEDRAYRQAAAERISEYNRRYRADRKDWLHVYYREYNSRRRIAEKLATPAWADRTQIRAIYKDAHDLSKLCGLAFEVDHIVPIKSSRVCGLHVHENLRIILGSENARKGNRWWPENPKEAMR